MTGGHAWFLGREADGPDAVRHAVRDELKGGASCIKFMASGGVYGHAEEPGAPQLTIEEMRAGVEEAHKTGRDRKSTRLNSSHANISYAVFCLKKKKHTITVQHMSSQ